MSTGLEGQNTAVDTDGIYEMPCVGKDRHLQSAFKDFVMTDHWWPATIYFLTLSIRFNVIYSKHDFHAVYIHLITYLNLFWHSKLVLHSFSSWIIVGVNIAEILPCVFWRNTTTRNSSWIWNIFLYEWDEKFHSIVCKSEISYLCLLGYMVRNVLKV